MTRVAPKIAKKRSLTAREAGLRFNRHPRTIRYMVAEDRSVYLERAAARRKQAYEMRKEGKDWQAIADVLGCSVGAVKELERRYRRLVLGEEFVKKEKPPKEPNPQKGMEMANIALDAKKRFYATQIKAGNSKAIRIPPHMAFQEKTKFLIERDGDRIILTRFRESLDNLDDLLGKLDGDIVVDRPEFIAEDRDW